MKLAAATIAAILATLASAKNRNKPIATFTLSDMPEEASSVKPVSFFLGPSDFFHLDPFTTITLPSDFPTSGNYIQPNKTIVVLPTPTHALQQRHELLQPRSTEQVLSTPTSPESVLTGVDAPPPSIISPTVKMQVQSKPSQIQTYDIGTPLPHSTICTQSGSTGLCLIGTIYQTTRTVTDHVAVSQEPFVPANPMYSIAPGEGFSWNHISRHNPRDVEALATTLATKYVQVVKSTEVMDG
ncbi:hypothetical protein LTR56_020426 [Elasticomyces elasticus]|nr:hypothetical protein LTR56_020426 [Elasticomyces elasticus]KAK3666485.1 hypothetical protein LTR22_002790 [Elasticomyces elasticus]KAK4931305.1 hypothetical protein LTR49_002363 [Elasticomyces elasticus]KAK5767764.1 hypothetical protein LTS12_001916 [Elasticomyces elasticus]